jgi:hypothetical protein
MVAEDTASLGIGTAPDYSDPPGIPTWRCSGSRISGDMRASGRAVRPIGADARVSARLAQGVGSCGTGMRVGLLIRQHHHRHDLKRAFRPRLPQQSSQGIALFDCIHDERSASLLVEGDDGFPSPRARGEGGRRPDEGQAASDRHAAIHHPRRNPTQYPQLA